ncbi:MAG: hypothetical protein CMB32_06815, partial [Euryarchaeota archaeon]|nr:hypothetical protein [Euryarchaeota archaeon]
MSRIILFLILSVTTSQLFGQTDIPGCTISVACNYNPEATINDGSCEFISCIQLGCTDPEACNYDESATINDGSCDYTSCLEQGCMNSSACNYNPEAQIDNGSCEYLSCAGCMDPGAPNFDPDATINDGSCESILGCLNADACNYNPEATEDDGSCDFTSCLVLGCTDSDACNYDADADVSDGSCDYADDGYDCDGNCLVDTDSDGVCDQFEIPGCDDVNATNYSSQATDNDGSCVYPVLGCMDFEACNYDVSATEDDGSCEFTSCSGCTSSDACNYDPDALYSDGSCVFAELGYDCEGNCIVDTDGDNVCDQFEVIGCMDSSACNYSDAATDEGSCSYPLTNYDCDGNNLQPVFTIAPDDVVVQGWEVVDIESIVVEAVASPFAPDFESQFNSNDCYDTIPEVSVEIAGEFIVEGNCQHDYTIFRSWIATDCAGYSSTHYQVVTVVDTVPPVLFLPNDLSVSCDIVDGAELGTASGTDDCGEVTITVQENIVPGSCSGSYEIHRTFIAEDPCLNITTGVQIVTVFDDQAPVITPPADFTVECSDQIQYAPASASDNCGTYTINSTETIIPGNASGNYTIARTFMAMDECGNMSTASQTITVVDTTSPLLSIPADYTIECTEEIIYSDAFASDMCGTVSVDVEETIVQGNALGNYEIHRTFTATDDAGNSSVDTQIITVEDNTAPDLIAPDSFTVECDEFMRLDDPLASDECGEVTITSSDEIIPGTSAGNYTVIRTFIATDDAGNSSYEAIQTINVIDTTGPELTIPENQVVECDEEIVYEEATAEDNCGPSTITVSEQIIYGSSDYEYTIYREFTATDDAGNSTVAIQTIEVVDSEGPVASNIPEDVLADCNSIPEAASAPTFTDNCSDVEVTYSEAINEQFCPGDYELVRTWTATDASGNETVVSQSVLVQDTDAPVFEELLDSELSCSDELILPEPTLLPGCTEETITVEEEIISSDCPQSYSIVRTFTATDACGNSSELVHTTNVVDNTAPEVVDGTCFGLDCPEFVNELLGESIPNPSLAIQDDCDENASWSSIDSPSSSADEDFLGLAADQYAIDRTFTLVDACGNEASYTQIWVITFQIDGCMDSAACNYNADANTSDDSCDFCSCGINACGCTDAEACNYDENAIYDDGLCEYPEPGYDCDGVCYDINDNDICDITESGCTDALACNYNFVALFDDGSCDYCNCVIEPSITSTNSNYSIEIELVTSHSEGDLAGQSTYRVYVTTPNSSDIVTAVTGNDNFPLSLATTTSFYQDVFGSNVSTSISPAMMVVAPNVAFDSWVTIGATSSDDIDYGVVNVIPGTWTDDFAAGNSFNVNDGIGSGWYLLPPGGLNGVSGDDNKVLLCQLTTDGAISGSFSVQIFPEGDQVNDDRVDFTFEQAPIETYSCPEILSGPSELTAECSEIPDISSPSEFDVYTDPAMECDDSDLSVSLISEVITEGSCTGEYTIVRILGITNCTGSTVNFEQFINVIDTTAPVISTPADYSAECSDEHPMDEASATDNCGEVTITVEEVTTAGACAGDYVITRTFTATD